MKEPELKMWPRESRGWVQIIIHTIIIPFCGQKGCQFQSEQTRKKSSNQDKEPTAHTN